MDDTSSNTLSQQVEEWQLRRSGGSVIHKEEKRSKKEEIQKAIGYRLKEDTASRIKSQEANDNRGATDAAAKRREAGEIDAYLHGLVMEGLVHVDYFGWHAKAVYLLSIRRYHVLVLAARRVAKDNGSPQKVLAFKVKSAMEWQQRQDSGIE